MERERNGAVEESVDSTAAAVLGGDARRSYLPILAQPLALYPSFMTGTGSVAVRCGYRRVAHIAHGWFLRCQRGAEALLILDKHGYNEEAAGIARSMIEHALALRWLAAEGDAIEDAVARGHAKLGGDIKGAVTGAGWTSIDLDDVQAAIDSTNAGERDRAADQYLHFVQRNKRYGDPYGLPEYIATCARMHPSYESAMCYFDPSDEGWLTESRDAIWPVPFATTRVLEALLALRQVFDPTPWEDELTDLFARYRTVTNQVRVQGGLAPIDWDALDAAEDGRPRE